jgi:hypothetical protein
MTNVPAVNAVASEEWRQLAERLAPGADQFDLDYFAEVCARVELSPFTSPPQIVLIGRYDKRVKRTVFRPQVTVDGRLALAVRSGRVVGIEGAQFTGPRDLWTDDNGQRIWIDVWDCKDEGEYPRAARYLIHVAGWAKPVNGTAPWLEFKQLDNDGKLLPLWARMPTTMLAKSALSLGLRRAGIENLPTDIAVAYEGDPDLAVPPGEAPAPPAPLSTRAGRGGPNVALAAHRVIAGDAKDPWIVCSCGERFNTVWAHAAHRNEEAGRTPEDVHDTAPESTGAVDADQDPSYANLDTEEDPERPF